MFYRYEIRKNGPNNVLYLYMSLIEETSTEFERKKHSTIEDKVKNFIEQNNIDYKEGPVYIVSNGIIIKSIDIKNKKINIEELLEKDLYTNNKFIIKIKDNNNQISIITLKEYIMSAILNNISYEYNIEVLKSVAILYRTYAYKKMAKEGYINYNDEFIKYKNMSYYKLLLFHDFENIIKKVQKAVDDTECIFITYKNLFINPYIHLASNGHTDESDEEYLKSVTSLWDLDSEYYLSTTKYTHKDFSDKLTIPYNKVIDIKITSYTKAGCINTLSINNKMYTIEEFIKKLNLPSKDMTILINQKDITIINRGTGNNLGLSLEGAESLSKDNCNYLQILNYYFPLCRIKKYI